MRAQSWASRVTLCREPSRDSSQPMFFSCVYQMVRGYETNNDLLSVLQYRSFCGWIYPNFTLNEFSCKRYFFNGLQICVYFSSENRFFYKGLQRVGYFLKTNLFSLLVNSFQSNLHGLSWEIKMRRCPNEWQVLRVFFTKYRNRLFWKGKLEQRSLGAGPQMNPSKSKAFCGYSTLGIVVWETTEHCVLSQKKKLLNDYLRFMCLYLESVRWLAWIA